MLETRGVSLKSRKPALGAGFQYGGELVLIKNHNHTNGILQKA